MSRVNEINGTSEIMTASHIRYQASGIKNPINPTNPQDSTNTPPGELQPTVAGLGEKTTRNIGSPSAAPERITKKESDRRVQSLTYPADGVRVPQEMAEAASPALIDKTMGPWRGVIAIPDRALIDTTIHKAEGGAVNTFAAYVLSRLFNLWDYLARWIVRFLTMFQAVFRVAIDFSAYPEFSFYPGQAPPGRSAGGGRVLNAVSQSGERNDAAVVAVSSSPVKGGPEDAVWMRFYTNKLNPLTPGHEKYMAEFIVLYRSAEKGSPWYEFFAGLDPDSPWQVVIQKAREQDKERPLFKMHPVIPLPVGHSDWYGYLPYRVIWYIFPILFRPISINVNRWWGMVGK